jgi:hypothetical protein
VKGKNSQSSLQQEDHLMKYMLLDYADTSQAPHYSAEQAKAAVQAWLDFVTQAKAAGVLVHSESLRPITDATTVRVRQGKTLTTDGPFAETHEQLGGIFLFDCKDLDEAIGWAAKMPGAKYGSIEVRPVWENSHEWNRQE